MGAPEDVAVEKALSDRYVSRMEPSRGAERPTGSSSRRRRAQRLAGRAHHMCSHLGRNNPLAIQCRVDLRPPLDMAHPGAAPAGGDLRK